MGSLFNTNGSYFFPRHPPNWPGPKLAKDALVDFADQRDLPDAVVLGAVMPVAPGGPPADAASAEKQVANGKGT